MDRQPLHGWSWDPTLYSGAAEFYPCGRVAYPPELAHRLAEALGPGGAGRLLDVGCGPGSLTLLLAPLFAEVHGVDADPGMLAEAARQAAAARITDVAWHLMRAEELPGGLPAPDVVTFAQSFHWMDRPRVAAIVRRFLAPGGALVHVHATTHQGVEGPEALAYPRPPRAAITDLIRSYLGTDRRAGQGMRVPPVGPEDREEPIYRSAGFRGPQRIELPGRTVERTVEQVRASVYSLSMSAPHLYGDRLPAFDAELRALLTAAAPRGVFSEEFRGITVDIWR